jgi:sortase A
VIILLYPIVATQYNDYKLNKQAQQYSDNVQSIEPNERVAQYLREAEQYNANLAAEGHYARPANEQNPDFQRYMDTLNPPETQGVIARITIPEIHVDLPIFHTTNSVISAHTGMVNASMFDNLRNLKNGDEVKIEVMGKNLRYGVVGQQVVKPEDYDAVTYEQGKDKITLITCTPYGINTDRLLVTAERLPDDSSAQQGHGWRPVLSWWMILDLILIGLVLLLVAYKEWKRRQTRKRKRELAAAEALGSTPEVSTSE